MPNSGSQGAYSSNWKSAVVVSKSTMSNTEIPNATTLVHNATWRELRAIVASSPRISRIKAAPSSGRNVTVERMGQSVMSSSQNEIPGDDDGHTGQHQKCVVIDIAALQLDDAPGNSGRRSRNTVWADSVDDTAVALFP